jgi:hypothetical protein
MMRVSVRKTDLSSLADGGANVFITHDLSLLVDLIKINPVLLGTALGKDNSSTSPSCTHKGFMPMPLFDGSIHYQPFLVHPDAANTIISPENIINNNHKFYHWCQEERKVSVGKTCSHPGCLSF